MLARLEKEPGVLAAWTDRAATRLVIAHAPSLAREEAIALVSSSLAPRYGAKEISGAAAETAIRDAQSGRGWYRAKETAALSREEAEILAGRAATRAARRAGLDAAQTKALERAVQDALVEVFAAEAKEPEFEGGRLTKRIEMSVLAAVERLPFDAELRARVKSALEEERR